MNRLGRKQVRVIRTEMYFDALQLSWPFAEEIHSNPGISAAFFGCDTVDLSDVPIFSALETGRRVDEAILRVFIDHALRNPPRARWRLLETEVEFNPRVVDYVLEQQIIVERSPAEGIPLIELFKGASIATIGTYVGMQAIDGHLLLFLTVPAGIIVVGSAAAVAKAIEKGLNKAVERLGTRRSRRQREK
jgi:hypothetical protein